MPGLAHERGWSNLVFMRYLSGLFLHPNTRLKGLIRHSRGARFIGVHCVGWVIGNGERSERRSLRNLRNDALASAFFWLWIPMVGREGSV